MLNSTMRRDNKRKAVKHKSYETEKPSIRARTRSNSAADPVGSVTDNLVNTEQTKESTVKDNQITDDHKDQISEVENPVDEAGGSDAKLDEDGQKGDSPKPIKENPSEVSGNDSKQTEASDTDPIENPDNNEELQETDKNQGISDVTCGSQRQLTDDENESDQQDIVNQQKLFANAANEVAARFYSSLNLLATRAFLNVKQEPMDMPLAEKCAHNLLSTMNGGYFGANNDAIRGVGSSGDDELGLMDASFGSPASRMLRPPSELSPETFAKQLRQNDSASMVVCRSNTVKNMGLSIGTPDSPSNVSRVGGPGPGQVGGGTSGLHQFVTRYTIERPDDTARAGVEICLEGDDFSEPIIEVECGGNKGHLYVTKLCQGSKGQSILFNDEWLTPNEFQFISGRETAKDWKRSIRHCGKSLKTLMTKGVLQVHPPVCECDYCKGHGPAVAEKVVKKRGHGHDRQNSNPETVRSGGSTTPSSTESITPLSTGISDAPSIALHKPGREGGLNSIISQLHSKRAITGNDVQTGNREESLDLSVRAPSRTSPVPMNGRKRQRESGHKQYENDRDDDVYLPMKRRHSNEDMQDSLPASERSQSNRRSSKEPLCLSSNKSMQENRMEKEDYYSNGSLKSERKGSLQDYNGICDLSREDRNLGNRTSGRHHGKNNPTITPPPAQAQFPDYFGGSPRGYRSNLGYSEFALFDAMKRAVANATGSYSDGVRTPPPGPLPRRMQPSSCSPHPGRSGFINLDSTSPRALTSRRYDGPSPHLPPMVELISPHRKTGGSGDQYDYSVRHRDSSYDQRDIVPHKAPVTVLHHHPNQYENPLVPGHRQSAPATPHTHHYYAMPPPATHNYSEGRRGSSRGHSGDRGRRPVPLSAPPRFDRRNRQPKSGSRRQAPEAQRRSNGDNGSAQRRDHRMMDLHHHAIPMMSLISNKKNASHKSNDKEVTNGDHASNGTRKTDSSPPALLTGNNLTVPRMTSSDDEISRKSDLMRRLSSSAPPPPFCDSEIQNGSKGDVDLNNNVTDYKEKRGKDDGNVFQYNRPRAKSASPNAPRSHPYYDGSRGQRSSSSVDAMRPESRVSNFQDSPFDNFTSPQQQYEMLRLRALSCAIEDMGDWTVDGVCEFLRNIGCEQYQEVFRDNVIDGDALPLLMEHHLIGKMGLKLGHALKLIARVHRRLGNHCVLVSDRVSLSRIPASLNMGYFRNSVSPGSGGSEASSLQCNGVAEEAAPEKTDSVPADETLNL